MSAQEAFKHLVAKCLSPEKARRFTELSANSKGQKKILDGLCHEFGPAILPGAVKSGGYDGLWESPCYAFHQPLGFGVEIASVQEAYDRLSTKDSWLILLRDGSAAIHRPEGQWDDEKLIG
jgi:hypothetical protein